MSLDEAEGSLRIRVVRGHYRTTFRASIYPSYPEGGTEISIERHNFWERIADLHLNQVSWLGRFASITPRGRAGCRPSCPAVGWMARGRHPEGFNPRVAPEGHSSPPRARWAASCRGANPRAHILP